MARQIPLEGLDPRAFMTIMPTRMATIGAAPADPLPKSFPANALAKALHPEVQHLKVSEVREHGDGTKSFTLVPDAARGTAELAYFSAGQYLAVKLEIGAAQLYKPYSIRSSPKQALDGCYILTIKPSQNGFASNYILESWEVGTAVETGAPTGDFTFEPLRDSKHILGMAGGSGITPFCSLAAAIADGTEDCSLTLLYGSRDYESILLREELDAIAAACDRVKIVHVLSDTPKEGFESGFITAELIKKYAPADDCSIFLCGPQLMYEFADRELAKLDSPKVRRELFGQLGDPAKLPGYPGAASASFSLAVTIKGREYCVPARSDESLLVAMERAGILAPSRCRSGECGVCHSKLVSGRVFIPEQADGRRLADAKYGFIHPCCSYPLEDIVLSV